MEPSTQTRLLTMTEQIPAQRAPTSTPNAASLKDAVKPMTYIRTSREAGGKRIKRFAIAASFAFESKTWSAETRLRLNPTATVAITTTAAAVANNNNNNNHIIDHDHDDLLVLTSARGRKASFWYRLPPRFWRGGGGYLAPHRSRSSAECCSKQYRDESQSIGGGYYCPKRFETLDKTRTVPQCTVSVSLLPPEDCTPDGAANTVLLRGRTMVHWNGRFQQQNWWRLPAVGEVDEVVVDVPLLVPVGAQPREPLLVYERF